MSSSPLPKRILLAVPSTQGTIKSSTAVCLVNLTTALSDANVAVLIHNIDAAEIVTARDMFANMVIHSPNLDGMLFVDSDMAFDPAVILRMLGLGVDVAAAAAPFRKINLETLVAASRQGESLNRSVALASEFNVKLDWDDKVQWPERIQDGFCLAAGVGMACAYISRAALIAMVEEANLTPRRDLSAGPGSQCWSFFGTIHHGGQRLSEDYSFCYRWTRQMGRQLWVCVDEDISHIGVYHYRARYSDLLRRQEKESDG